MRLISCHIENFGRLQDCSMDFEENMNVICEENGWGKSTFAAFIRAMFYGLEGERKRSIEDNERKRYKPWQGGVFGGQLVFEERGRRYEIIRIFQDKEANDEFELRDADTNLLSNDYSERVGEELFQVGRESFLHTVFISQSACGTSATDDISAKIGNITDNTNDLNNYENANIRLAEMLNKLTPSRKTGSLAKRRDEIAQLERLVQDGQEIGASLERYQDLLQEQENAYTAERSKLQEMTALQKKVAAMQSVLAKKEEWEHLKNAVREKQQFAETLKGKFPKGVPTREELRQAMTVCGEEERIRERLEMTKLSEEERKELETLDDCFQKGIPEEHEVEEKLALAGKYRRMRQEYEQGQLSSYEQQRYEQLGKVFRNESEPVSVIIGKWNERNNRKAAMPSKQATLTALQTAATEQPKRNPVVIGAGIVLFVCAVLLCVRALWIPGIVALLLGVLLIGISGNGSKKEKTAEQEAAIEELQKEIAKDTEWIKQIDSEVGVYLDTHGKTFDEYMVATLLQQIMEELVEYHTLQKKAGMAASGVEAKQLAMLEQELTDFLERYEKNTAESSYEDRLYTLRTSLQRYQLLAKQERQQQEAWEEWKEEERQLADFLQAYGYTPAEDERAQLNELQEWVQEYQHARNNQEESARVLAQFEESVDTSIFAADAQVEGLPSLENLNDSIANLTESMQTIHKRITDYHKTLEQLGNQYDEWEENREQLEHVKEIQEEEQRKFRYLTKTQAMLSQAKESLISRYTAPVLAAFERYYASITGQSGNDFHMDANIMITVTEQGRQREVNTLSAGYQDLVGICLRLAFVDAMYEQEKPMLVLDDPFTNLDDEKLEAARRLLSEVAKQYQVIYFTCSRSRDM